MMEALTISYGAMAVKYDTVTVEALIHPSRYEDGTREPSIDMLKKLCDLYDVSADFLIGRTDY